MPNREMNMFFSKIRGLANLLADHKRWFLVNIPTYLFTVIFYLIFKKINQQQIKVQICTEISYLFLKRNYKEKNENLCVLF